MPSKPFCRSASEGMQSVILPPWNSGFEQTKSTRKLTFLGAVSWWARVDYASRAAKNSPQGCFSPPSLATASQLFSSTLVSVGKLCKTKSSTHFHTLNFLGGRGWITRAAHLKKPRRGFFPAGLFGGSMLFSSTLVVRYKVQIKQKLQRHNNAGVLGGRGWITQAAHLKKPRRGFFPAGLFGGSMLFSSTLVVRYKVQIKQKLQRHNNAGVLGGRGWITQAAHLKKPRRGFFPRRTIRRVDAVRIHPLGEINFVI